MNALWLWLAPVIAIALLKSETHAAHVRRHAAGSLHNPDTSAANSVAYPSFLRQFSNNVRTAERGRAPRNKRRKAIPCPKVFNPVCGILSGVKSTFLNECTMNAENIGTGADWEVFSDGICAEDYSHHKQKQANERKTRFHNLQNDNYKTNVDHTPTLTRTSIATQSPVSNSYSRDESKHYDMNTELHEFLKEFRGNIVFIDAHPIFETHLKENFDDTYHNQNYLTLPSVPGLEAAHYSWLSKDTSSVLPINNQYQIPSQVRSSNNPTHFERTVHYPVSTPSSHSTPYKMDVFLSYLAPNSNLDIADNMNNIYSPLHTQDRLSTAENSSNPKPLAQSVNTQDGSSSSSSSEEESKNTSSRQEDTASSDTEGRSEEPNDPLQREIDSNSSESGNREVIPSTGSIEQDSVTNKTAITNENEFPVPQKTAKILVNNDKESSKMTDAIDMGNFDIVENKNKRNSSTVESEENGSSKTVVNAEEPNNNTTTTFPQLSINKPKNKEMVGSDPTMSHNEHSTNNESSVSIDSNIKENEDVQEAVEASEAVEPKTTFSPKEFSNTASNKEDEKLIAAGSENVFRTSFSTTNDLSVRQKAFDLLFNSYPSTSHTNNWQPYPYGSFNAPRPFYPINNPDTFAQEAQYGFTSKNDQVNIPETSSSEDSNTSNTSSETSDSIEDNSSDSSEQSTSGEYVRSMLQSSNLPYQISHSPHNSFSTDDLIASRETYNQLHNENPDRFLLYAPKDTQLYKPNQQPQASKDIVNDVTADDAVYRKSGPILNEGNCNYYNDKCTTEYNPICISRNGVQFTIASECWLRMNKCRDEHSDWQIIKKGECSKLPKTAPTTTVRKTRVVMYEDVAPMPKTADTLDNLIHLPLLSKQKSQRKRRPTTTATTTVAPITSTSSALNVIISSYKPTTTPEYTVRDFGTSARTIPRLNQYKLESVKLEAASRNLVTQADLFSSTSVPLQRLEATTSSATTTTAKPTTTPITTLKADPQTTTSTTSTTTAATTKIISDILNISPKTESTSETSAIVELKAKQSELITGIPTIRSFPTTQATGIPTIRSFPTTQATTTAASKIAYYPVAQRNKPNTYNSHIMYLAKPKDCQIIKHGECGDVATMPKTADTLDNLIHLPLLSKQKSQTKRPPTTTATTTVAPITSTSSALNVIITSYTPTTPPEYTVRDFGTSARTVPRLNQYELESVKLQAASRNLVTQANLFSSTSVPLQRLETTTSSATITTAIPTTTPITTLKANPQTTTSTTSTTTAATTKIILDIFHSSPKTESTSQTSAIVELKAIQSELITGIPTIRSFPTTQATTTAASKIAYYPATLRNTPNPYDSHIMHLAKRKARPSQF